MNELTDKTLENQTDKKTDSQNDKRAERLTERRTSLFTKILIISIAALILMSVFSNALVVGERLGKTNEYLEYAYYALIIFIIVFGIIYPFFGVLFAPIFSLDKLHTADGKARKKWCRLLTNNLLNNVPLTKEEREQVKEFMNYGDESDDKLIEFFDRKIRPEINSEMMDTAKKVMILTAVSQNSLYDMISMASANFCLVKRIVEICGFRPTTPQVMRLYLKILSYTFLAGTIEDLDIEEYVPMMLEGTLGKIGKLAVASVTQGLLNALTTLRIAAITKNYLLNANVSRTRREIRRQSYQEAAVALKELASQFMEEKVSNPVKSMFSKKKTIE